MSYTPTEWTTGDVITAEKLNNMESGIEDADGIFIINATNVANQQNTSTTPVLDKTYSEMMSAYNSGKTLIVVYTNTSQFGSENKFLRLVSVAGTGVEFALAFHDETISTSSSYATWTAVSITVTKNNNHSSYNTKNLSYYTGS